MQRIWEFFQLGGPVMYVLAGASIAATAILFERLWALQRTRVLPPRLMYVVRQMLAEGRLDEARKICATNESAISAVLLAGLRMVHAGRAVVREAMQDRGRREAAELENYIGALGAIVTISPLLGLLGTITGMIETFQGVTDTVAATGSVNANSLAGGIWEALITTAAGLMVAIPAFVAHRLLLARVDSLVADLEEASLDLGELICPAPPVVSTTSGPHTALPGAVTLSKVDAKGEA
jgi:biopolymer transport protein ExbB